MQGKSQSEYQKHIVTENGKKRIGDKNPNFGRRKYYPPNSKDRDSYVYYVSGTQPIDWIPCKEWWKQYYKENTQ
jgi:hypothetical protein